MRLALAIGFVTLPLTLGLAACGGGGSPSAAEAQTNACNAMADIRQQIDTLQGYTPSEATADRIKGNLDSIQTDLQDIEDSLPDQKASLQSKLETAVKSFRAKLDGSLTDASGEAKEAQHVSGGPQRVFTKFATFYIQTLGFVPC